MTPIRHTLAMSAQCLLLLCLSLPADATPTNITGISFSPTSGVGHARLLFADGRPKVVTMSFDDATAQDRRLVKIFNAYGIRGTFHVPLTTINMEGFITTNELRALYTGHEVSIHDGNTYSETNDYRRQVVEARDRLTGLIGYVPRGLAYVGGDYTAGALVTLPSAGIIYARGIGGDEGFYVRTNFLYWTSTCHQGGAGEAVQRFLPLTNGPAVFSIWGHSYEFEGTNGETWTPIEGVCRSLSGYDNIWYASLADLADYLKAAQQLSVISNGTAIYNPSATSLWVEVEGLKLRLPPNTATPIALAGQYQLPAVSNLPAPAAWTAFNDAGWDGSQLGGNLTLAGPAQPTRATLLDHASGQSTGAKAVFTVAGGTPGSGSVSNAPLPVGSDAYAVFGGKVTLDGYVYLGQSTATLSITNLNPASRYQLVLYGSRGGVTTDYSNRWTEFVLTGAPAFSNASSVGVPTASRTLPDDTARLIAGNVNGLIARFAGIDPGSDGAIAVEIRGIATPGTGTNAYFNAFMLQAVPEGGSSTGPEPQGVWRQASVTGTMNSANCTVYLYTSNSTAPVYVDDLTMCTGTAAEAGANCIVNPGFEAGTSGWDIAGSFIGPSQPVSAPRHSGAKSFLLQASTPVLSGGGSHSLKQLVTGLSSGGVHTLSVWYYATNSVDLVARFSGHPAMAFVAHAEPVFVEPLTAVNCQPLQAEGLMRTAWNVRTGRVYRVMTRNSLTTGSWQQQAVVTSATAQLTVDAPLTNLAAFVRLLELP